MNNTRTGTNWAGWALLMGGLATLSATSCAIDTGDDTPGGGFGPASTEEVAELTEPIPTNWVSGPFSLTSSGAQILSTTISTGGHICVLTRVRGTLRWDSSTSGRDSVDLSYDQVTDDWQLNARGNAAGSAYCFKRSGFEAFGSDRWVSDRVLAKTTSSSTGCATDTDSLWEGDAASMISGLRGKFRVRDGEGNDVARINQANGSLGVWSTLQVTGCNSPDDATGAYAQSFFVGTAGSGTFPKYVGSEHSVQITRSRKDVAELRETQMASTQDAMCYFTEVNGSFIGSGEWVEIVPRVIGANEYWMLRAHSNTHNLSSFLWTETVGAKARCFKRNQT